MSKKCIQILKKHKQKHSDNNEKAQFKTGKSNNNSTTEWVKEKN